MNTHEYRICFSSIIQRAAVIITKQIIKLEAKKPTVFLLKDRTRCFIKYDLAIANDSIF